MSCSGESQWPVIKFRCDLPNGVHARPPVWWKRYAIPFRLLLTGGIRAATCGESALAIIATNTIRGDECQLTISGEDEQRALAALSAFIQDEFPLRYAVAGGGSIEVQPVPQSLSRLNLFCFTAGRCVAGAPGHAHPAEIFRSAQPRLPAAGSIEHEQALLDQDCCCWLKISSCGCWITTEPPAPFWRRIVRWRRMLLYASICWAAADRPELCSGDRRQRRALLRSVPRLRQPLFTGAGAGRLFPASAASTVSPASRHRVS